eukprot:PhF_6_TR20779/c0_g1_i1/m.29825/K14803/PTC2_3; protein phosphatase PTC2/3
MKTFSNAYFTVAVLVGMTTLWFYMFSLTPLTAIIYFVIMIQVCVIRKLYLNAVANSNAMLMNSSALGGGSGQPPTSSTNCSGGGKSSGQSTESESQLLQKNDMLNAPVTDISTVIVESKEDNVLSVTCGMQGWRRTMEDGHCSHINFVSPGHHLFGVFDGHCGKESAEYCANHFAEHFETALRSFGVLWKDSPTIVQSALQGAFMQCDEALKAHAGRSGTTACVVFLTPSHIFCANAGDSRAVLSKKLGREIKPLSVDHKPTTLSEAQRIRDAKGFVWNRRVNGVLALSRALGDFSFKQCATQKPEKQAVTAYPDVTCHERSEDGEEDFIVLACDGIWDVLTNDQAVQHIHSIGDVAWSQKCQRLLMRCLSPSPYGIGCDNMTATIIVFGSE